MKITFASDGLHEGTGFAADIYRGIYITSSISLIESCSPRTVEIKAAYGSITDGSTPIASYPGGQSCSWHISRGEEETIHLSFDLFKLYDGDVLAVFEGTGIEGKSLGMYVKYHAPLSN